MEKFDLTWSEMLAAMTDKVPMGPLWLTGGRKQPEKDAKDRYELGRLQVESYIEFANAGKDDWRPLEFSPGEYAVEVPFEIVLDGTGIIGYIDQVIEWRNGAITTRDLKTGTKLPNSPFQLGTYRLGLQMEFGIETTHGDYFMCKNQAPTALMDLRPYTRDVLSRWYGDMDQAVRENIFLPNPGDMCRICDVEDYCTIKGTQAHLYPITPRGIPNVQV